MNLPPHPSRLALGETFGLPVPTRYSAATHDLWNTILAADSAITPSLLNLSPWVRRVCWGLSILLLAGRLPKSEADLRTQLQLEAAAGIALLLIGLFARMGLIERLYLLIGGVLMLANALMTQVA